MTTQDAALTRHNGVAPAAPASMSSFLAQGAAFMQLAKDMAASDIIPKDFKGKPANVFLAIEMAHRLNLGTMEVMQNLYVVHGTPSLSSKFLIGLANRSGRFRGGLRFDANAEVGSVRCYATDRETEEELEVTVTMAQAVKAGWANNSKYDEIPEQMLSYRAATFFVRRYCPEVMLGMMTVDEAQSMPRSVAAESKGDPLAQLLDTVLDKPDETAKAIKDAVHVDAKEPAPYAPPEAVAKLLAALAEVGVTEEEAAESFGPLDRMDRQTFDEAREYGRAKSKAAKAEAARKVAAPPEGVDPATGEMFAAPGQPYDPDSEPF
jgi:hypothetical protein